MNFFFVIFAITSVLLVDIDAFSYRGSAQQNRVLPPQPAIVPYRAPANPPNVPGMPNPPASKATIVKQEFERFKDGGYRFFYETSDGSSREEVGFFKNHPKLGKVFTVHGSFGYITPTKKKVFVKYTSDERGYRQENSPYPPAHLPSNIINQQLNGFKL